MTGDEKQMRAMVIVGVVSIVIAISILILGFIAVF